MVDSARCCLPRSRRLLRKLFQRSERRKSHVRPKHIVKFPPAENPSSSPACPTVVLVENQWRKNLAASGPETSGTVPDWGETSGSIKTVGDGVLCSSMSALSFTGSAILGHGSASRTRDYSNRHRAFSNRHRTWNGRRGVVGDSPMASIEDFLSEEGDGTGPLLSSSKDNSHTTAPSGTLESSADSLERSTFHPRTVCFTSRAPVVEASFSSHNYRCYSSLEPSVLTGPDKFLTGPAITGPSVNTLRNIRPPTCMYPMSSEVEYRVAEDSLDRSNKYRACSSDDDSQGPEHPRKRYVAALSRFREMEEASFRRTNAAKQLQWSRSTIQWSRSAATTLDHQQAVPGPLTAVTLERYESDLVFCSDCDDSATTMSSDGHRQVSEPDTPSRLNPVPRLNFSSGRLQLPGASAEDGVKTVDGDGTIESMDSVPDEFGTVPDDLGTVPDEFESTGDSSSRQELLMSIFRRRRTAEPARVHAIMADIEGVPINGARRHSCIATPTSYRSNPLLSLLGTVPDTTWYLTGGDAPQGLLVTPRQTLVSSSRGDGSVRGLSMDY